MSKRFTNIEIDNRGDIILLDDDGVFTVYNLQELEDLLNKQDNIIQALNDVIKMYVPEDEHDFVAEVIYDAIQEGNK